MMKVMIFEGGEGLSKDPYTVEILNWSTVQVELAFINYFSAGWANEELDGAETPTKMISTVEIINPTIATAVTCSCDWGMTYMVRIEEET